MYFFKNQSSDYSYLRHRLSFVWHWSPRETKIDYLLTFVHFRTRHIWVGFLTFFKSDVTIYIQSCYCPLWTHSCHLVVAAVFFVRNKKQQLYTNLKHSIMCIHIYYIYTRDLFTCERSLNLSCFTYFFLALKNEEKREG